MIIKTTLKRYLRRPVVLFVLLIMPIVCLLIDYPYPHDTSIRAVNNFTLGVSDYDKTPASQTLIAMLSEQYDVLDIKESEITTMLTNKGVDWAVVVPEGFQAGLLSGNPKPIDSYGLTQIGRWLAVKGNMESMVGALRLAISPEAPQKSLSVLTARTPVIAFEKSSNIEAAAKPKAGLMLYVILVLFGAYLISKIIIDDKTSGMAERITLSPVRRGSYLLSNLAVFSILLIVQNGAVLGAYTLLVPDRVGFISMLSVFALLSVMSVGLMLMICAFSRSGFVAMCSATGAILIFSMLGGLFLPIDTMPEFMQWICSATPVFWFTKSINSLYETGVFSGLNMLALAGFALLFFILGSTKRLNALH